MAYVLKEETRIKREKIFKEQLSKLTNDEVVLISEFYNNKTPAKFFNKVLNEEFEMLPGSIKFWCKNNPGKYYRSPNYNKNSSYKNKRLSFEEAYNRVREFTSEYELIEYETVNNCKLKHLKCGHVYSSYFNNIFSEKAGHGCPECDKKKAWNHDRFIKEVYDRVSDEYEVKSKYTRMTDKVLFKHKKCGHEFKSTANNFIHGGNRCPNCSHIVRRSKPVVKIENYLIENNISYEKEVSYDDLYTKYGNRKFYLYFDFKIYTDNGYFLLEYDGFQHENGWNGNENSKRKNIMRDQRKNNYCKAKNIPLFRINYRDEHKVVDILKESIKTFNDYPTGQRNYNK